MRGKAHVLNFFKGAPCRVRLLNRRACVTLFATIPVKRSISFLVLSPLMMLGVSTAQAAPGLSFNVSARVAPMGQSSMSPQTVQARVLLSGQKARIDTTSGGRRAIVLYTPPYVYRLLPESQAGVRWKLSNVQSSTFGGFDPQQLLRNPSQIRASLLQNGAKITGKARIGGVPVDVFELSRPNERFSNVKAWLRHKDALPLRFEAQGSGLKVVALWSNYARVANASSAQFSPPGGYSIRQSQNAPVLPLL